MKNLIIIIITIFISVAFSFSGYYSKKMQAWDALVAGSALPQKPLKKSVHIKINPSIELDFKSKEEIYDIRRKYIRQYPELAPEKYEPSEVIFGQIVDGKPWWGELGASYYGPGENGITGMSEESRYMVNPYVLVGIDTEYAFTCYGRMSRPVPNLPVGLEMIWESRTKAHAYFDVKTFMNRVLRCGFPASQVMKLNMVAYNARDFGYNYLAVDIRKSENILPFGATSAPQQIKQYIHCGPSCGHHEGCNNMSPHIPDIIMPYKKLPAKAYVKLWKAKPASINDTEDFSFIIYMM